MARNAWDLGKMEGIVERLEVLVSKMEERLTTVEKERSEERGGRKMLILIGGFVATGWGIVGSIIGTHMKSWLA